MKNLFSLGVFVVLSLLFFSNNSYAQNNPDIGKILKYQLNKFLNSSGDAQLGCDEALKVKKRIRLQDGSGECDGFVDEDGDGICDKCGGAGDCDRTRDKEGDGLKRRGGN